MPLSAQGGSFPLRAVFFRKSNDATLGLRSALPVAACLNILYSILAFYSLIRSPLAFYRGGIKYGVLRFAVHRTFGSLGEHHTCEKTSSGNFPPQGASGNCLLILPSATPPYSAATTVSSDSCLCMFRGRNSNSPRSRPQSER